MHDFLDWFRLEEFFPIVMLSLILAFVGQQTTVKYKGIEQRAGWFSAIAFLLYAGAGVSVWGIQDHLEVFLIAVRGLLASGVAFGIGMIFFSIAFVLQKKFAELRELHKKKHLVEPEPPAPLIFDFALPVTAPAPPPPPPPTREELAAQALKEYEEKLTLIDKSKLDSVAEKAARLHAQQQYTKKLDQIMK